MKKFITAFSVLICGLVGFDSAHAANCIRVNDAAVYEILKRAVDGEKYYWKDTDEEMQMVLPAGGKIEEREVVYTYFDKGIAEDVAHQKAGSELIREYDNPEEYVTESIEKYTDAKTGQETNVKTHSFLTHEVYYVVNGEEYKITNATKIAETNESVTFLRDWFNNSEGMGTKKEAVLRDALYDFYLGYNSLTSEICDDVAAGICKIIWPDLNAQARSEKCALMKSQIANTMRFGRACTSGKKGSGVCDKETFKNTRVQYRPGVALARLNAAMKQNKKIYCATEIKKKGNQDYLACKSVDGSLDIEYEFDTLEESTDGVGYISLSNKACSIMFDKYSSNVSGCLSVRATEDVCKNKLDKMIFAYFGGGAKYAHLRDASIGTWIDKCNLTFGGGSAHISTLKNDLVEYGVDNMQFKIMQVKNGADLEPLIRNYVKIKMQKKGAGFGNFRCDPVPGRVNVENLTYDSFITCHVNNKYNVDFLFHDTSELSDERSGVGLTGLQCVGEHGGTFDGKNCVGLDQEQCTAAGKKMAGGTRWDDELGVCVMNNATTLAAKDKAAEIVAEVAGIAVAVVAAIPTGGGSLAILGFIGTSLAIAGQVTEDVVNANEQEAMDKVLFDSAKKCKSGLESHIQKCSQEEFGRLMEALAKYEQGITEEQRTATENVLLGFASNFTDDMYLMMNEELERQNVQSEYADLRKMAGALQTVGAALGIVGFVGDLAGAGSMLGSKLFKTTKTSKPLVKAFQNGIARAKTSKAASGFTKMKNAKSVTNLEKTYNVYSAGTNTQTVAQTGINIQSGNISTGTGEIANVGSTMAKSDIPVPQDPLPTSMPQNGI